MARWPKVVLAAGLAASLPTWLVAQPAYSHRTGAQAGQRRRQYVVSARAPLLNRRSQFDEIRVDTDRRNEAVLQAHSSRWGRDMDAAWQYAWPFDSPHGWDAASSYDWTYYWWRAARIDAAQRPHQDSRHNSPAQTF